MSLTLNGQFQFFLVELILHFELRNQGFVFLTFEAVTGFNNIEREFIGGNGIAHGKPGIAIKLLRIQNHLLHFVGLSLI